MFNNNNTELFDLVECMFLHNQLVQRAVQAKPSLRPIGDVLRAYPTDDPLRARLTPDVQTFLSSTDPWPVQGGETASMTEAPANLPAPDHSSNTNHGLRSISPYEDELILL
jgi:hypothetical protein